MGARGRRSVVARPEGSPSLFLYPLCPLPILLILCPVLPVSPLLPSLWLPGGRIEGGDGHVPLGEHEACLRGSPPPPSPSHTNNKMKSPPRGPEHLYLALDPDHDLTFHHRIVTLIIKNYIWYYGHIHQHVLVLLGPLFSFSDSERVSFQLS